LQALSLTLSTFDSNIAQGNGGGVYSKCTATLNKCESLCFGTVLFDALTAFLRNSYTRNAANGTVGGGGVYADNAMSTVESYSTYTSNFAAVNGGGLTSAGLLYVTYTTYDQNTANANGGSPWFIIFRSPDGFSFHSL